MTRGIHGDNVEVEEVPNHLKLQNIDSTTRHKSISNKNFIAFDTDQDIKPLAPRNSAFEDFTIKEEENDSNDGSNSHSQNSNLQIRVKEFIQYHHS